jgi:competence protein ComEA
MYAWLDSNWRIVLAGALVVFFVALASRGLAQGGDPQPLQIRSDSMLPLGAPIRVHVAGAVLAPGVYELREGDRLIDALAAAGGPTDAADREALNLARRVRDEEQVLVPTRETARTASAAATLVPGTRLDINVATAAQLDQLPGIGEAYSRRIVDSRAVDGPFATTEDLVSRRVLPRATYERVRDLISAGR